MKKMYIVAIMLGVSSLVSVAHAQVPTVSFTQTTYEAREGTSARIQIRFDQPVTKTTRVKLKVAAGTARAGIDFTASTPIITFYKNGLQTKSIVIPIKSDRVTESQETVLVSVTSIDNKAVSGISAPKATLAIIDSGTAPSTTPSPTCVAPQVLQGGACVTPSQGGTGQSGYKWLGRTGANFSPAPPTCTAPVPVEGASCTAGSTMCTMGAITFTCLPPGSTSGDIVACLKPVESRNCVSSIANNDNLVEFDIYTLNGSVENISSGPVRNIFTGLNLNLNIPGAALGRPNGGFFNQERITATTDSVGNVEYKVIVPTGKRISGAGSQLASAKSTDDIRKDIESTFSFYRGFVGRSSGGGATEENIIPSLTKVELESTGSTAFRLKNKVLVTSMGPVANYATNGTVSFIEYQGATTYYKVGPNAQYCDGVPEFFNLRPGQFKTRFDQLVSRVEGGSLRIDTDRRYIELGSCSFVEDYKAMSSIPGATHDATTGKWKLQGVLPGNYIIDGSIRYRLGGTL